MRIGVKLHGRHRVEPRPLFLMQVDSPIPAWYLKLCQIVGIDVGRVNNFAWKSNIDIIDILGRNASLKVIELIIYGDNYEH